VQAALLAQHGDPAEGTAMVEASDAIGGEDEPGAQQEQRQLERHPLLPAAQAARDRIACRVLRAPDLQPQRPRLAVVPDQRLAFGVLRLAPQARSPAGAEQRQQQRQQRLRQLAVHGDRLVDPPGLPGRRSTKVVPGAAEESQDLPVDGDRQARGDVVAIELQLAELSPVAARLAAAFPQLQHDGSALGGRPQIENVVELLDGRRGRQGFRREARQVVAPTCRRL
jgi:hypothetical protein